MARNPYKLRRLIASVLLVVYGTVGILGYGLHELFHVHHGQADGVGCCAHASHCCSAEHCHSKRTACSHSHGHSHSDCAHSKEVTGNQQLTEGQPAVVETEHECAICAFLAQAQEMNPDAAKAELVEAVTFDQPASEFLRPLYLPSEHLARGPPHC